jgi:uncharacterized membrane protein YesL
MGAATSAVYYVTLKMAKDEEGYIIKNFWKGFKQNFKQGIIIEFILLTIGIVLYADIRYFLLNGSIFAYFFVAVLVIASIIYVFTLIFVFPIIAWFNNTISGALKSAVIMPLKHLSASIWMTILLAVMLYGFYTSVPLMVIYPFIAVSGYAFIGSIIFRGIFNKY